jgi:DNA-binding NtrC family response regulator
MNRKAVLIVDDEADIRELLVLTLSRMGTDADTASSFAEAQEALKARPYDLCLTDMRLPDGDGLMVLRHIAENYGNTPVAVITAYGSTENAVAALKAGAFGLSRQADQAGAAAAAGDERAQAAAPGAAAAGVDRRDPDPGRAAAAGRVERDGARARDDRQARALAGSRCTSRASRAAARKWRRALSTSVPRAPTRPSSR